MRNLYFFIHSFVFGVLAYGIFSLPVLFLRNVLGLLTVPESQFLRALLESKEPIRIGEIYIACSIAILNGFILSKIVNSRYLHKLARRLRVGNTMGDADVWGFVHNSGTDSLKWVRVRDHGFNLVHEGWIESFSDTFRECELFLRDVRVFRNDTGEQLYDVSGIYLARDVTEITLEFFALDTTKEKVSGNQVEERRPADG